VPYVVPWLPYSFGSRGGTTVLYGSLAPQQGLRISRLGASIAAYPPVGQFTCETGWGFVTGVAPEGTTILTVTVEGPTVERSGAAAFFGNAFAYCELYILCEEFVPLAPVDVQFDPSTLPGSGPGDATIASPGNPLAGRVYSRTGISGPTVIINQTTPWGFGLQGSGVLDRNATAENTLTLPIAPGNAYRCWIKVFQVVGCHSPLTPAGWAFCNFTFDFGPIYYTFGS
jgi:hypothetical protein